MPSPNGSLVLVSAGILLLLGFVHLAYTFWGPKLVPRDPALVDSMKAVHMVITAETSVWRAWIGFNATHSMALLLFGLVYGHLALARPDVLYGSPFLLAVGFLMLAALTVLAWRYFFSTPAIAVSIALVCYVAGVLVR